MLNPYGSSPIAAIFQGFTGRDGGAFVTRAAYNCTVTRVSQGVYLVQLNTGVDDANFAVQTQLWDDAGNIVQQSISYNPTSADTLPGSGQIRITFITAAITPDDPGGLFNIIVYQCTDGVDNTPGAP
jgi:hypothetical protein